MRGPDRMGILLAAGIIALDQITKGIVTQQMALHQSVPLVPGFLSLTYVRNTGAAFGILASPSPGLRSAFLLLFSIMAIGIIVWIWARDRGADRLHVSSFALILGGALGNVIDRVRLGEVIDFVDVYWRTYHWPAFNVADSAITVGVVLLVLQLIVRPATQPSR